MIALLFAMSLPSCECNNNSKMISYIDSGNSLIGAMQNKVITGIDVDLINAPVPLAGDATALAYVMHNVRGKCRHHRRQACVECM